MTAVSFDDSDVQESLSDVEGRDIHCPSRQRSVGIASSRAVLEQIYRRAIEKFDDRRRSIRHMYLDTPKGHTD